VEKLKQFAFEGHSMHATRCLSTVQSARTSSHVAALLPSIDVCSVFGPPRSVTLIACISSLQHVPKAFPGTPQRYAGREEEKRVSKHTAGGGRRLN